MSLIGKKLPQMNADVRFGAYKWDAPSGLLDQWAQMEMVPQAKAEDNVIEIFDQIGEDFWGDGVTAKGITASLRDMSGDITVKINSPGGNVFEGMTIYNAIRRHQGAVRVEVMGLAASAASVIAMAGDEIVMDPGSMMMIHNAWGMVIGNRHDLADTIPVLEKIDGSMSKLYQARTGLDESDVGAMMDAETFMTAEEAVEKGFATALDEEIAANAMVRQDHDSPLMARRRLEAALAKDGVPRHQREEVLSRAYDGSAPRDASGAPNATRDAGILSADELSELSAILKTKQ